MSSDGIEHTPSTLKNGNGELHWHIKFLKSLRVRVELRLRLGLGSGLGLGLGLALGLGLWGDDDDTLPAAALSRIRV
jgi:hypothetical protein